MKQNLRFFLILLSLFILKQEALSQGVFYREYGATFDETVSNHKDGRWRVNDEELSLHERFGKRSEARANGLMLINVPEDLFELESAQLYLELWGGHAGTANKRFYLNGRGPYHLPLTGVEQGHETYSYPEVQLKVQHMVNGINAVQFACDREKTFWGHFIIDNACVRCYLKPGHPDLVASGLKDFNAIPVVKAKNKILGNIVNIHLEYDASFDPSIASVDYFGRYLGYDDNGNREEDDWHGFTFKREYVNHLGKATKPPFAVDWNTRMIPTQGKSMAIRAVVHLKDGFKYRTPIINGFEFPKNRNKVQLYKCLDLPRPFHSRASNEQVVKFYLPDNLSDLERAQLWIKTWDGGEGTIKEPFKINDHPYHVISGKHIHDVVFTIAEMNLKHLKPGENEIRLLSDTEHHGIEVLLPGPCFILRYKSK